MEAYDVIVNQPVVIDNVSTGQRFILTYKLIYISLGYWCYKGRVCWWSNTKMQISKLVSTS